MYTYSTFDLMAELMVDFFLFLFVAAVIVFIIQRIRKSSAKTSAAVPQKEQQKPTNATQIVEDIKMTQTTSTTDAVNILDDLGGSSPGYRHYCELIGTSQTSGGVTAPYSKREVAYYDLRCYRIESREGRDIETLIAHEKSIDPFYFTDSSGDQRIYVDLDSFNNNVILLNSTNRVEGANSEVSQALNNAMAKHGAGSSPRVSFSARALDAAEAGANWLSGAVEWTRRGLAQAAWQAQQSMQGFGGMQPAFAGAATGLNGVAPTSPEGEKGTAMLSSGPRNNRRAGLTIGFGSYPPGLDSFLGGALSGGHMGGYGGPFIYGGGGRSVTDTLLTVGLGMLLSGIRTTAQTTNYRPVNEPPRDGFRGYRIIEDVVPMGCPIYGLGEIYRNGNDVHIAKSVSPSYPSSYFACKHEAEVIEHLSN